MTEVPPSILIFDLLFTRGKGYTITVEPPTAVPFSSKVSVHLIII